MGATYNPSTRGRKHYIVPFMSKLTIATWNVNSVRAHMPVIAAWAEKAKPDILLLQETKTVDADFPFFEFSAMGFPHAATHGQKSYNGVAILSRLPILDVKTALPGEGEDGEARFVSGAVSGVRVASVYAPNGNPANGPKFPYKIDWLSRLASHAGELLRSDANFIFAGDFNIIPEDIDVESPEKWRGDALMQPEARQAFRRLLWMGMTDAWRALHAEGRGYTFWDYQSGAWQKDDGIRIDHALLSPRMADRLVSCEVDKGPRGMEKASDHTPLVVTLECSGEWLA